MLKNPKSQLVYLLRLLEYCGKIIVYTNGLNNYKEFLEKESQLHFNASLTLLVQIGEQTLKLDETIKEQAAAVPWHMVKGFRNIAVHEYVYADAQKVFEICTIHIPELRNSIEKFIKEAVSKNLLSPFELKLSVGSIFYMQVRFEELITE